MTTFEEVLPVADAVLYEGYVLYPYRADDAKNVVRWQFGVLAPPSFVAVDPSERSALHAELLLDGRPTNGQLRLRFLQVQRRTVERSPSPRRPVTNAGSSGHGYTPVDRLRAGDVEYLPFDEAAPQDVEVALDLTLTGNDTQTAEAAIPGGTDIEEVPGGRLVRTRLPLTATITVGLQPLPGPHGVRRLTIEVRNTTRWQENHQDPSAAPDRAEALRRSLVAAHLLVRLDHGRFLSLTDPPEWAADHIAGCRNDGVWPVLAGPPTSADLTLCSPIILPDHPRLAPESTTQFCDGTEIDEMLSLRALTLTDAEKRAVRGTDARAAQVLDRVEGLPADLMDRLHGAIRYLEHVERPPTDEGPPPGTPPREAWTGPNGPTDAPDTRPPEVAVGTHVMLRPRATSTDAQDLFLAGRPATVMRVVEDVDGQTHLAVVLDDDPGRDVALDYGRFLYFRPDEVEPIGATP
ncbi:MAG: hypothetical protein ACTHJJ_15310 [Intrasporangium sp.]|uniref:hypothetical protein n=1 Tax=Intrasporangium sp. TaxID=1925024 RepID=UPI003F8238F3